MYRLYKEKNDKINLKNQKGEKTFCDWYIICSNLAYKEGCSYLLQALVMILQNTVITL